MYGHRGNRLCRAVKNKNEKNLKTLLQMGNIYVNICLQYIYLICIPTIHIYCCFAGAIRLWRDYYERDGTLFEVTEIRLDGNNSRFKYNHHL